MLLIYLISMVCWQILCLEFYFFVVVDAIFVGSSPSPICLGFVGIFYEHIVMFLLPFVLGYDVVVVL